MGAEDGADGVCVGGEGGGGAEEGEWACARGAGALWREEGGCGRGMGGRGGGVFGAESEVGVPWCEFVAWSAGTGVVVVWDVRERPAGKDIVSAESKHLHVDVEYVCMCVCVERA